MRRQHITISTGHPCCDGVTFESRPRRARTPIAQRILRSLRVHHVLLVLAAFAVAAVPLSGTIVGDAEFSWMLFILAGAIIMWVGTRMGPVPGAVGFMVTSGALIWHAIAFGRPLGISEALLLTGLLAIAQMLFSRGMEVVIGIGFGLLFFIGSFSSDSMGDTQSIPVAVALVTAFIAAAWTVASLIRRERETRDRYRNLVKTAPIAMFDFDLEGLAELIEELRAQRIDRLCEHLLSHPAVLREALSGARVSSSNQAAAELFEVDDPQSSFLDEAIGWENPITVPLLQQVMVAVWDDLRSLSTELTAETTTGRRMHLLCAVSLPAGGPRALRHAPASAVDLTHQKALEEDLHAQLAERDRFVASISHELRTPLTSVLGLGQSLLDQPDMPTSEMAEILRIMVKEGQDLAHIIEDLLVGARLELGPLDIVTQQVSATEEVHRLLASLDVDVAEIRMGDPIHVLGNKVRFRQILRNMLTNAEKYGGPRIRIVTGRTPDTGYVDVRDDGDPIAEGLRSRMFEPYQRLHSQPGTTDSVGLGLAVSRSLARAMGGDLEYAHDGVEGIFRVSLPLIAADDVVVESSTVAAVGR